MAHKNKLSDREIEQRRLKAKYEYNLRIVQGINLIAKLLELADEHPAIQDAVDNIIVTHSNDSERRKFLYHLYGKNGTTRKEVKSLLRAYGVKIKQDGTIKF